MYYPCPAPGKRQFKFYNDIHQEVFFWSIMPDSIDALFIGLRYL